MNERLKARRTELEENLYDGILAHPVQATSTVPIYGTKPIAAIVDAANATVFNNVLNHFKQLVDERQEVLSEF